MNCEIINVGTELLLGEIVNTNAPKILKMCRELGFNVYYQSVVGDNPQRLLDTITLAFDRGADCVITTGGLGPTQDDVTKNLSAKALGLDLVYNEEEAEKVRRKCEFVSATHNLTANNFNQAWFPEDAYILENPVGTANGCVMHSGDKMIANLPGPPKECIFVLEHSLRPYMMQFREPRIWTKDILVMGIGESAVDTLVGDLEAAGGDVTLAPYAGEGLVRLRLGARALTREEAEEMMAPVEEEIKNRLGTYIIPEGSIRKALAQIMVPCKFTGDMKVPAWFEPYLDDKANFVLDTRVIHEDLGDRIHVTCGDETICDITSLHDYTLGMSWLENKLMFGVYRYLKAK